MRLPPKVGAARKRGVLTTSACGIELVFLGPVSIFGRPQPVRQKSCVFDIPPCFRAGHTQLCLCLLLSTSSNKLESSGGEERVPGWT